MIPRCHNRPEFVGQWLRKGTRADGKPIWRWYRYVMSQMCGAWSAPDDGVIPEPIRANWQCAGCRWLPQHGEVAMAFAATLKRLGRPRYSDI